MGTDTNIMETTEGSQSYGIVFQSLVKASLGNGVWGRNQTATDLKVTERASGVNMSVDVAAGDCIINGIPYTEASTVNLTISAAHVSLDRRDLIVYDQSAGTAAVVTGTPGTTANPPNVSDANDIPLAIVLVSYGVTVISNFDIMDIRGFTNLGYVFASDNLRHSNNTEKTTVSNTYAKIKEILINDSYYRIRIKFGLKNTGADTSYAKIYKNGVAIGTEQTNATAAYVTKTEDIATSFAPGDLLQIYAHNTAGANTVYVNNMRLYYDYTLMNGISQDP